jgi:hypothetical protein
MVDMKVLVYSNLSKIKYWKKKKSPTSMKTGSFHPPKCRGKLKNMGVLHPFLQNVKPILKLPHKAKNKYLKN